MKYNFSTYANADVCTKFFKYYCYSQAKQYELMCIVLLAAVDGKAG